MFYIWPLIYIRNWIRGNIKCNYMVKWNSSLFIKLYIVNSFHIKTNHSLFKSHVKNYDDNLSKIYRPIKKCISRNLKRNYSKTWWHCYSSWSSSITNFQKTNSVHVHCFRNYMKYRFKYPIGKINCLEEPYILEKMRDGEMSKCNLVKICASKSNK